MRSPSVSVHAGGLCRSWALRLPLSRFASCGWPLPGSWAPCLPLTSLSCGWLGSWAPVVSLHCRFLSYPLSPFSPLMWVPFAGVLGSLSAFLSLCLVFFLSLFMWILNSLSPSQFKIYLRSGLSSCAPRLPLSRFIGGFCLIESSFLSLSSSWAHRFFLIFGVFINPKLWPYVVLNSRPVRLSRPGANDLGIGPGCEVRNRSFLRQPGNCLLTPQATQDILAYRHGGPAGLGNCQLKPQTIQNIRVYRHHGPAGHWNYFRGFINPNSGPKWS